MGEKGRFYRCCGGTIVYEMNKKKILYLTELAILVAVILLMAFTPLGYLRMPMVQITFLTIPVIVGAVVMGPLAGGILGGVFGLTSLAQCFGIDPFGMALMAINPVFTGILCLVPRILVGVLAGHIFKLFPKKNIGAFITASISGALLNTVLFIGGLMLMFGTSSYITGLITEMGSGSVWLFFVAFVGINGLVEAGTCAVIGTAVSKAVYTINSKKFI